MLVLYAGPLVAAEGACVMAVTGLDLAVLDCGLIAMGAAIVGIAAAGACAWGPRTHP